MSLTNLAPELVGQIFSSLHSIADVLSLAQACKRLNDLLRSSQRLPTLFAAAEREYGPLDDIVRLVTWNRAQNSYSGAISQKTVVSQSPELLKQIVQTGRVAIKIQNLYPSHKWGEDCYLERRSLTQDEEWRIRRAVYRYWLFCEAFHNKTYTRNLRRMLVVVEERSRMLRGWRSDELFDIEDVRLIIEAIVSEELCPTDGRVMRWSKEHCEFADHRLSRWRHTNMPHRDWSVWNSWPPDRYSTTSSPHALPAFAFHSHQADLGAWEKSNIPVPQRRKVEMCGWGDDVDQYYVVQSMLKLDPGRIMHLYETATTKDQIEWYINREAGSEWFWDNGQTWTDTWSLVLSHRGWDLEKAQRAIDDGYAGVVSAEQEMDASVPSTWATFEADGTEQAENILCL